jgi:probable addiction module antidote protein
MPKRTSSYRAWQTEKLANPVLAARYLDVAMEDSQESFLIALRNVAQARQMAKIAKETGVQRESLYRILSDQGNPTLETLRGIYDALGLKLVTMPKGIEPIGPFGDSEIHTSIPLGFKELCELNETNVSASNHIYSSWFISTQHSALTRGILDDVPAIAATTTFLTPPPNSIRPTQILSTPEAPHYLEHVTERIAA